jgi:hypothetical protein
MFHTREGISKPRLYLSQDPWKIEENVRKCGRSWRTTLTLKEQDEKK